MIIFISSFLDNMIHYLGSWLPFWDPYMLPVFCLCFIAFAGRFVINLFRG